MLVITRAVWAFRTEHCSSYVTVSMTYFVASKLEKACHKHLDLQTSDMDYGNALVHAGSDCIMQS